MLPSSRPALPGSPSAAGTLAGSPSFSANARRNFALIDRILAQHNEQADSPLVPVYQKPIRYLVARTVGVAQE